MQSVVRQSEFYGSKLKVSAHDVFGSAQTDNRKPDLFNRNPLKTFTLHIHLLYLRRNICRGKYMSCRKALHVLPGASRSNLVDRLFGV